MNGVVLNTFKRASMVDLDRGSTTRMHDIGIASGGGPSGQLSLALHVIPLTEKTSPGCRSQDTTKPLCMQAKWSCSAPPFTQLC